MNNNDIVAIRTFVEENGASHIQNTIDTTIMTKQETLNTLAGFANDPSISIVQTKRPIKTTLDCNPLVTYSWFTETCYPISLQE